ncbi:lysM and putative peptidoglycan-binding domain-containing protein 4 [Salminus brasiliensis]|uniref:lysM and putative peptidoglycan-binding domain-containing protein 4 n=1 Tax=Salminus brasiliensis TaxID=930266 RepID=UPI003B831BF4
MRRGEPLPQAFQAPVDVHASEDGQVYMFRGRQEELEVSSEDEEFNIMELRPRNRDTSSQERSRLGELMLLERKISHEDNLNKLALQYGCKVADIKRVNNLIKEQDLYALTSIKIPVKKHGLLTETNSELRDPQQRPSSSPSLPPSDQLQDFAGAGPSVRPRVEEYTHFLREVDNDIERLIQSTDAQEEVFGGSSNESRQWGLRGKRLTNYGADWGIQWWNAVIAMLLIGIVLPIFYVVYFKTQDRGESTLDNGVVNSTLATSNNSGASFSTTNPNSLIKSHLDKP